MHTRKAYATRETSSVSDDDPRWRSPEASHGFETGFENGSAAEELRRRCACLHHGQVATDLPNTRLGRDDPRPMASSPLIVVPTTSSVPPCSGLSRRGLETTERAARAERRPTLTAPVRAGLQHVWVGAKKRDSKSNKETEMKEVENAVKSA